MLGRTWRSYLYVLGATGIVACNGSDDGDSRGTASTAPTVGTLGTLTNNSASGDEEPTGGMSETGGSGGQLSSVDSVSASEADETNGGLTTDDGPLGCAADSDCPEGQACDDGLCAEVPCTADNVGVGGCVCAPGATQACYSGDASTQNVGLCVGGQQTCDPSGKFWGLCEGEVTPGGEVCGTGLDEDCDGQVDEDGDADGDGFTVCGGDCCDQDGQGCEKGKLVNPGAFEVGGNGLDDDCNGSVDDVLPACDGSLDVASNDPMDGARAVELCKVSTSATDWGVVSATYVQVDGSGPPNANFDLGHGLVSGFGPNVTPKAGGRMLGLSSGTARQPSDPGFVSPGGFGKGYQSSHPPGFPKESPACPGVVTGTPNDSAALELQIRVPTNAYGFAFDFAFYTFEWPGFVCSQYNDFFVALLTPIPMGQADGNIAFDMMGNPISVNNAFLDVCGCGGGPPCFAGGKQFLCPLGTAELEGTGFESHAGTSWLTTTAPVTPGSVITVRWGAYDSGDGVLDSTAILDNWRWEIDPNTKVETIPQ